MAKVNIGFHALPEEILGFVRDWTHRHALLVATVDWPPLRIAPVRDVDRLGSAGIPRRIYLSRNPPALAGTTLLELAARNRSALTIDVGERIAEKLTESFLSATGEGPDAKLWASIAADLRRRTTAGLWGVNPASGAAHFYRNKRYTRGAAEAARQRVQLAAVAGWVVYSVDQPNAFDRAPASEEEARE